MTNDSTNAARYAYAVTGDHSRLVYSRHKTLAAAERAARTLANKWGRNHPGSEPRVVELDADNQSARHIGGGKAVES